MLRASCVAHWRLRCIHLAPFFVVSEHASTDYSMQDPSLLFRNNGFEAGNLAVGSCCMAFLGGFLVQCLRRCWQIHKERLEWCVLHPLLPGSQALIRQLQPSVACKTIQAPCWLADNPPATQAREQQDMCKLHCCLQETTTKTHGNPCNHWRSVTGKAPELVN